VLKHELYQFFEILLTYQVLFQLGEQQLVERQSVERQLGVVNWAQRQLVVTAISRRKLIID